MWQICHILPRSRALLSATNSFDCYKIRGWIRKAIFRNLEKRQGWFRNTLRQLVEQESPSEDALAVNAAVDLVVSLVREQKARVKRYKQSKFGDLLELRFGPRHSMRKPILLLGHLDTVWPMGTLRNMSWREADGRYWGPGVLDMKAGVVMALTALSVLREMKLARPVTLLLNSDEEVGSPISRTITERLAMESSAVLVLEPAQGLAYKTARKGVGQLSCGELGCRSSHERVDSKRGLRDPRTCETDSNHLELHGFGAQVDGKLWCDRRWNAVERGRFAGPR